MKERGKKLQSDVEALNHLKLEMKRLNDTVNQSNGEKLMESNKSSENAEQTSKPDVNPIQNDEELDKPTIEMQTSGAQLSVKCMNGEAFKYGIEIEMGDLVVIAGLVVKMLPGNLKINTAWRIIGVLRKSLM
jgi:hypothetical protein